MVEFIREKISTAKESVKIASPWIDQCMLEKVLEVLPKGVKLEVILRAGEPKDLNITGEGTFKVLEKYGAELYIHEKLSLGLQALQGQGLKEAVVVLFENLPEQSFLWARGGFYASLHLPVKEEDQDLQRVMKINLSGYSMDLPIRVGSLVGKSVPVYVDLAKISSMHMTILGTTGSGKTTFSLFPIWVENIKELFKDYGLVLQEE